MAPVTDLTPTQPDISYFPDFEKYKARTLRNLAQPDLVKELPVGWPEKVEGVRVWEGKDYENKQDEWIYTFSAEELAEIDSAVHAFEDSKQPLGELKKATFQLPKLGPQLEKLSDEIFYGRGFFVTRGLPVDKYSRNQNVIAYVGISSYIGELRAHQGADGTVLAHISDLRDKKAFENKIAAPAFTSDKQVFHTDMGDVISLFALDVAAQGGTSRIASFWRVYNEMAATRPDLIQTLSTDWVFDNYGRNPKYVLRPLLFYVDGKLIIQYARRVFTGFGDLSRSKDIPPLTESQAEALDAIHFGGEKYNLEIKFQKGDMQFINNLSLFHARDGYTDDDKHKRHLLRLWLRNEEKAWKVPEQYESAWQKLYYSGREQKFPMEPEPDIRQ